MAIGKEHASPLAPQQGPALSASVHDRGPHLASQPPRPTHRSLRGYAFDPSLATSLDTAVVSEIIYRIPWEDLEPGPRGEYIEVVDYDPPSGCFYAPVDLDHPHVLAAQGLAPSEGNPQFHQQMVYAVAMTTIDRFERALGRKAFWADRYEKDGSLKDEEQYVQRLRIYPHAMRMANAYYSHGKRSVLCGYFPATEDRSSGQFPRGMVFTCLSHDIIAHEVTHALLDGSHGYFLEATNPDMLAFHEGFADIVALFQHFTFPEILAHQIARTRGNLESDNLLAQLAAQFGRARGSHGALRDAIGRFDAQRKWERHAPDPTELDRTLEVHGRGAILVAAIFDAFLAIYKRRTSDLMRLASGGAREPRQAELHPDLIQRLAGEASVAAGHVLNMCIRALDYCPPVDLTFGEYLRALITADMDLYPQDQRGYRVALIEAFRRRGIYPDNLRTLSEDSLRWVRPEDPSLPQSEVDAILSQFIQDIGLRAYVDTLRYLGSRKEIWAQTRKMRAALNVAIRRSVGNADVLQRLTGLAFAEHQAPAGVRVRENGAPKFALSALREARRSLENGRALNQVFITILQSETMEHEGRKHQLRCGCTLVIDLDELKVKYVIGKGLRDKARLLRTLEFQEAMESASLTGTYFGPNQGEPFAALHNIAV